MPPISVLIALCAACQSLQNLGEFVARQLIAEGKGGEVFEPGLERIDGVAHHVRSGNAARRTRKHNDRHEHPLRRRRKARINAILIGAKRPRHLPEPRVLADESRFRTRFLHHHDQNLARLVQNAFFAVPLVEREQTKLDQLVQNFGAGRRVPARSEFNAMHFHLASLACKKCLF